MELARLGSLSFFLAAVSLSACGSDAPAGSGAGDAFPTDTEGDAEEGRSDGGTGADAVEPPALHVELCNPWCDPLEDDAVLQGEVRLTVEARVESDAFTQVGFFLNGDALHAIYAEPWVWTWNTEELDDGSYDLVVRAETEHGDEVQARFAVAVNNCDLDRDGLLAVACGGEDCDDANPEISHNGCGGCDDLEGAPGGECGACGTGVWICDGLSALTCEGDQGEAAFNVCGGCERLRAKPGQACRYCEGGACTYACDDSGDVDCVPLDGFVLIPAGTFVMGSPEEELGRTFAETQHTVTLTRDFLMMETEVTQAQWETLARENPSHFSSCGTDCPVEQVSWFAAIAFANALSVREGLEQCYQLEPEHCADAIQHWASGGPECDSASFKGLDCSGYRLPTEAEWEYAARAGDERATYNGELVAEDCSDSTLTPIAWFCGNADDSTNPSRLLDPNAWGLFDMLGNVREWTGNWNGPRIDDATDPLGPETGERRVARGGSWIEQAYSARAARTSTNDPGYQNAAVGFRLVRTVP